MFDSYLRRRWNPAIAVLTCASVLPACTYPGVTSIATSAAETAAEFNAIAKDYSESARTENAIAAALNQPGGPPADPWSDDQEDALQEISRGLITYFGVIATLAADETVNFDTEIDGVASNITTAGFASASAVGAYSAVAKVTASAVAGFIRHSALKAALRDADAAVAQICDMYTTVTMAYQQRLAGEVSMVGFLDDPDARVARLSDLASRARHAEAFLAAVSRLKTAHNQLATYDGDLDTARIKELAGEFVRDVEPSNRKMRQERSGGRSRGDRGRSRRGGRR